MLAINWLFLFYRDHLNLKALCDEKKELKEKVDQQEKKVSLNFAKTAES